MRDLNSAAAARIRGLMAQRGITQERLAAECGWKQQRLSRRLTGEVALTLDELAAAAAALGVCPLDLLRSETEPTA